MRSMWQIVSNIAFKQSTLYNYIDSECIFLDCCLFQLRLCPFFLGTALRLVSPETHVSVEEIFPSLSLLCPCSWGRGFAWGGKEAIGYCGALLHSNWWKESEGQGSCLPWLCHLTREGTRIQTEPFLVCTEFF